MKTGLKFFPETLKNTLSEIGKIRDAADFVEIMAIRGTDFSAFDNIGVPVTVHAEHHDFGSNPADPKREAESVSSLLFASEVADRFDSPVIVVHPGFIADSGCSVQQAAKVLKSIGDKRIILENLIPDFNGKRFLFYDPANMEYLVRETGFSICLDASHAALTAEKTGKGVLDFYREMLKFRPGYFHFSDTNLETRDDQHLHLGKGNLPVGSMKNMIPKDAMVCLEVQPDLPGMLKDLEYFRTL